MPSQNTTTVIRVEADGVHGTEGANASDFTFTLDSHQSPNHAVYTLDEKHTLAKRYQLELYRNYAKRNGNMNGSDKCRAKITTDFEVEGYDATTTVMLPAILEISFSVPRGVTAAETLELRELAAAFLRDVSVSAPWSDELAI